ncbi:MAG: hypothetical protein V4667_12135 [Bacteroidota bacterium]
MKINNFKIFVLVIVTISLASCVTQSVSTITSVEFNESKNQTDYFVLPYGTVSLPGKWTKRDYKTVSRQQFFTNKDSIKIAIAFGRINNYEFNTDGKLKGYDFVRAYYEWDSNYFVETHGLKRLPIETDSINHHMIYRIYGKIDKGEFDTYFFIGERNGNINNYSISDTDKWTEKEKVEFLKSLFITKKNE